MNLTRKKCFTVNLFEGEVRLNIIKPSSYEYENKYFVLEEDTYGNYSINTYSILEIASKYGLILTYLEEVLPKWKKINA